MAACPFLSELLEIHKKSDPKYRFIVGIVGAPASGKSTLAEQLSSTLNTRLKQEISTHFNMDGYHYYNDELYQRGIYAHKGAHFTFNAEKFITKLIKIKEHTGKVLCPIYDRMGVDNPIEDVHEIKVQHKIVVVEGNYLLLSVFPWITIRDILNYCICLEVDRDIQIKRLLKRHIEGGKSESQARNKIELTDLPNGELILKDKDRADYIFRPAVNFEEST